MSEDAFDKLIRFRERIAAELGLDPEDAISDAAIVRLLDDPPQDAVALSRIPGILSLIATEHAAELLATLGSRRRSLPEAGVRDQRSGELPREARALLEDTFGHEEFLPGQEAVIATLLERGSAIAIFPTGGGKSLCYQLPALLLDGTALVVSPLKALMKDQVDTLRSLGIAAARLDGGLSYEAYTTNMEAFVGGELDLLYVAPERFNNDRFLEALGQTNLSMMAIDEAHCISEWGHDFRPEYLRLGHHIRTHEIPRVLCLTATATKRVERDMAEDLAIPLENVVRLESHRDNLDLEVTSVQNDRVDHVERLLGNGPKGPAIVYVTKRDTCEEVADALRDRGFEARPFHAGLPEETKLATQDRFIQASDGIVVSTIAFGMGVDKPDIRQIIHYNLPKSIEGYLQEIGRAGRDGDKARCAVLYHPEDVNILRSYHEGLTPDTSSFHELLYKVFTKPEYFLNVYAASRAYGFKQDGIRTIFAMLESRELIQGHTPFNTKFRYRLFSDASTAEAALPRELAATFRRIQQASDHKQKWSHLELRAATGDEEIDRSRLATVFDELEQRELGEVNRSNWFTPYEILQVPGDLLALAEELHRIFSERETYQLQRIDEMVDLLGTSPCLWKALADYLGDPFGGTCGHCNHCTEPSSIAALPRPEPKRIPREARAWIQQALEKDPDLQDEPLVIAHCLCGVWSPAVQSRGLHYTDGYKQLVGYDVRNVEAQVASLLAIDG